MPARAVINVDLDDFFVSVEQKRKPEIKNRPIIVGADGDPSKRGAVLAASFDARSLGVISGMPLRSAYRLCPQAVFLPVDFEAYEKYSDRFMDILRDYSPLVESFGLDEGFVEIAPAKGEDPFHAAARIAGEIKSRIEKELGLTPSVGVGPNKLLAKTACELGKPGGFFMIYEKDIGAVLRELPVRKLPGVGAKTEKRLKDLGASTVGELSRLPLRHLERNFGPDLGKTLFEHSRGIDLSPVVAFRETGSICREVTFDIDAADLHIIKEIVYGLSKDLAARLKGMGCKGITVSIKVRYENFRTDVFSASLSAPTDSLNDVWVAAAGLLESVESTRMVRLVGVKVAGLTYKKNRPEQ